MFPLFQKLFEAAGFQPLGECYSWQTDVLVANVSGNALIALTYFRCRLLYTSLPNTGNSLFIGTF